MRKAIGSLEEIFFLCASFASLAASAVALFLRSHTPFVNHRVRYGFRHLPAELLAAALFIAFVAFARPFLARIPDLAIRPTRQFLAGIGGIFALFWVPVWFSGGFVQDDWLLLAAASIRKIIVFHPAYSWFTLDSVDGNFRPLGTVLYFGYILKWFGPAARAFTLGPLVLTLLASLVAFAIVRELGYSRIAAAAASLLFLSRGMIYTIVAWASALGDGIAILFCGLTALFILKANRCSGSRALLYHLLAWLCFAFAILGKQSAFVTPLIVALLLFLRPGQSSLPSLARRAASAAFGLCIYTATAAIVFLHAKSLLNAPSPYSIGLSLRTVFQTFAYPTWYFLIVQFPDRYHAANFLPGILGLAIVAILILLACRFPSLLGDRPRDLIFAGLAAAASISLFTLLGTRSAPYYGCMAAFWFSIALAIVLTRFGPPRADNPLARVCCFLFCLLVVTGFAEVRIEQTGLVSSGGYIWGTYGMDTERAIQASMEGQFAKSPEKPVLELIDCPFANPYTSIALLDAPTIERILLYNSRAGVYTANNHQGLGPSDTFAGLTDTQSYQWTQPLDPATARKILTDRETLRLRCIGGTISQAADEP